MPIKTDVYLRTLIVGQGMRPAVNQGKKGIETGTNHKDIGLQRWQIYGNIASFFSSLMVAGYSLVAL